MKNFIFLIIFVFSLPVFGQYQTPGGCAKAFHSGFGIEKSQSWISAVGDGYNVHHYSFYLQVSDTSVMVSGLVACDALTTSNMDSFWVELDSNVVVDSAKINGQWILPCRIGDVLFFPLNGTIATGTSIHSEIFYRGAQSGNGFFSAVTNQVSQTYKIPVTWTLSEPFGAIQWWPCKQDNYDKIDSVDFYATCLLPAKVGSNGMLVDVDTLVGGLARYHWKHRYPIDFYLIHFACAKYLDYRNYAKPTALNGDSILIQHFLYDAFNNTGNTTLNILKPSFDKTPRMLEQFSDLFVLYPFWKEKYGHVQAELGGGMEHQTMTTLGSFGSDVIAHELSHQWWGDFVTCGTWNDIWLNEGWASYCEYLYRATYDSLAAYNWMVSAHNTVRSIPDGSVYVPSGSGEWRIFDNRLTYKKGAAILHQLRYIMGDSSFFVGVKKYLNRYAYGVATTDSFRIEMEKASGLNLQPYFQEWFLGEGFPSYEIKWNYHDLSSKLIIQTHQTTSAPIITSQFTTVHIPVQVIDTLGGSNWIALDPQKGLQDFTFNQKITNIIIDPKHWIITGNNSVLMDPTLTPSGVSTPNSNQVFIYPNPSNGDFFIQNASSTILRGTLFSSEGKLIRQFEIFPQTTSSMQLSSGAYWFRGDEGWVKKLIAQ